MLFVDVVSGYILLVYYWMYCMFVVCFDIYVSVFLW